MFSFNDNLNQSINKPQNNNSLFRNNKNLFNFDINNKGGPSLFESNQSNSIFAHNHMSIFDNNKDFNSNDKSLFKTTITSGSQSTFQNSIKNNSLFNNNISFFSGKEDNNNKSLFRINSENNKTNMPSTNNKWSFGTDKPNSNSLFTLNPNEKGGLFTQLNFKQENSISKTNNIKGNTLFQNSGTEQNQGLFGKNLFSQNSLFNNDKPSNTYTFTFMDKKEESRKDDSLFNFSNNDTNSLFTQKKGNFNDDNNFSWLGNNKGDHKEISLFETKNETGKSSFNNSIFDNTLKTKIFSNVDNKPPKIFTTETSGANNNSIFSFPNPNRDTKFISENKPENKVNINTTASFNTQKFNNNEFVNLSFFGQGNNNTTNTTLNTANIINNKNETFLQYSPQIQFQINNNMNNIEIKNNNSKEYFTSNDLLYPFQYLSEPVNMNGSTQELILPNTINESVEKQKSMKQFLDDLEQKYNNKENINDDTNDILDNYGTYQDNIDNKQFEKEISLFNSKEGFKSSKTQLNKTNETDNIDVYNMEEMSNRLSKVNSIYQEYEKYKNQFKKNTSNNYNKNTYLVNIQNNFSNNYEPKNNKKSSDFLGRNEALYHQNMIALDKLSNNDIKTNNKTDTDKEKDFMKHMKENGSNYKEQKISNDMNVSVKDNSENQIESVSSINKENVSKEKADKLVPLELVPKLTKEGYKCVPSIMELCRKSEDELKKIEGFKICNKYGEVEFLEPINLLGIDLDKEVKIEQNMIETGDELDYHSRFKLFNFKIGENGINNYKINLEKAGGKLLEYKNNEIVWEYKKE